MKPEVLCLFLVVCLNGAFGEKVLKEFSWYRLEADSRLQAGKIISDASSGSGEVLRVSNAVSESTTFHVFEIDDPGITKNHYAIVGEVRCDGIEGKGFLETWNHFPDSAKYFSRTLGDAGPMKNLEGSSGWREFALPFFMTSGKQRPTKIDFNVVLPGKGAVFLKSLKLVEYEDSTSTKGTVGQWWSPRTAGGLGMWIGILGAVFGVLCGLCGVLEYSGRGRRFVMGVLGIFAVLGALQLSAGGFGLWAAQPYHVYYPLLLSGGIDLVVACSLVPVYRKTYEQVELRKIRSMDGC